MPRWGTETFPLFSYCVVNVLINFDYAPMGDGNTFDAKKLVVPTIINFDYAPMGDGNPSDVYRHSLFYKLISIMPRWGTET